jgi:Tol biopolymer transport system component
VTSVEVVEEIAPVIVPTDTATPAPTSTEPPAVETEEVVLVTITGRTATPTDEPTLEPTATDEPAPTLGPTPIGGGPGMIAFASNREGSVQIWTINVDGTNPRRITNRPDGACQPAWSPDGMQLVFIAPCTKDQGQYENTALFIVDIDGNDELGQRLTQGRGGDYDPSWGPNGLIAFASDLTNQTSIYTIDPAVGGDPVALTKNSWNYQPDWSPDGKQIAMVSTRLSPVLKVFVMPALGEIDPAGGRAKEFSRGQDFAYNQPRFSPNGEFLMYKKSIPFSATSLPDLVGSSMDDFGRADSNIATAQRNGPMNEADFSPDGKWIVYEGWPNGDHHIFIMTDIGSAARQVTIEGSNNFDAAWRPVLEE